MNRSIHCDLMEDLLKSITDSLGILIKLIVEADKTIY